MKSSTRFILPLLVATAIGWLPAMAQAAAPSAESLDAAIKSGDFAPYLKELDAWLNKQLSADGSQKITAESLETLLGNAEFVTALDQRQLIAKTGFDKLGAFAKADPANQAFLGWLLKNRQAMDLYLEAVVPIHLGAREQNAYTLSTAALEVWRKIHDADPEAREGIYLRLAIATAIALPGTGAPGAGQAAKPVDPLARYQHFKIAHQNKELFPSFDALTVWEYTKVVQSGASNEDLAWGRQMINTWRPDLRINEQVVNSTSEVWRRNSPIPFNNTYKNVLAGGGKCGPRSSWAVFICQAFGIPAIGVGQPAHACVAYKAANPMTEPQPGSAWKVGYGRGWQVSKLEGMSGPDFLAGTESRSHAAEFSKTEHLRWLAAALTSKEQASAVMDVAHEIQKSASAPKTDLTASLKPEEADHEAITKKANQAAAAAPPKPIVVNTGATQIEPSAYTKLQAVRVLDCFTGGKQVNFDKNTDQGWIVYTLDVGAAGTYTLEMKVAAANVEQVLKVQSGEGEPVTIQVPHTQGLWGMTQPVEIKLNKGIQVLRIAAPFQRGVAIRSLELKSK